MIHTPPTTSATLTRVTTIDTNNKPIAATPNRGLVGDDSNSSAWIFSLTRTSSRSIIERDRIGADAPGSTFLSPSRPDRMFRTTFLRIVSRCGFCWSSSRETLHFSIEGKSEFRALLFLPAKKPMNFDYEEQKAGLKLYVQRVLIMENCEEVLPPYLRFVKGVIDSADLPLNVSRELLQQNPHLDTIRKNVVRNILSGLDGLKNTEYEKYVSFYRGLGPVLKEGLARDYENKEKVADLLLFEHATGEPGTFTTLADYAEKMPEGQDQIYYLAGENAEQLRHSPYLESFRAKGYDVLLLTDSIDEFTLPHLSDYKGKKLQAADRGEVKSSEGDIAPEVQVGYASLLTALKGQLPEVTDVRLTRRLTESAACLVVDGGMSAHMERILKRAGQGAEAAGGQRVLELNPDNPAVVALKELHARTPEDARLPVYARLLYEQAVIAEGSRIADPAAFAKRVNTLIAESVK